LKFACVLSVLLFAVSAESTFAKDIPVQARLFAGTTKADPQDLNTELGVQGLKEVDSIAQYGVELSYPLLKFFDVGLRYSKRYVQRDELTSMPLTDYKAQIDQDSALLIARIPFLKTNFIRVDAFAGFGGSNTTLTMKTATQDGELSRKDTSGWFASHYASYGGSMAFGYKQIYLVVEGGLETNKVSGLKRTGTINSSVNEIDLSGSYVTVGLLFDGVPARRK